MTDINHFRAEVEKLRAEVEKLRAALARIENEGDGAHAVDLARAALTQEKREG